MKIQRHVFAIMAWLWIFFFIADRSVRLVSRFTFLRRRPSGAFVVRALQNVKGFSLFLLIIANIILVTRWFDIKAMRSKAPVRG
ncbi:MAG TPA: hypothetical protein VF335_03010 [Chitinivibrionales bacterium]